LYINYVKNSVGTREENIAQFYFWGQQSSSVRFLSDLVAVSLTIDGQNIIYAFTELLLNKPTKLICSKYTKVM
jgi:spore germination protein GerM